MEEVIPASSIVKKKVYYDPEKPLNFSIEISQEEWDGIKPSVTEWSDRSTLLLQPHWPDLILDKVWEQYHLECPFPMHSHKFFKRKGFPYLKFNGKCSECKAPIEGILMKEPSTFPFTIAIDTFDTRNILHKKPRQTRNKRRDEAIEALKHVKAIKYKHQQANEMLNDSGSFKSDCEKRPDLNTTAAYNKMRQDGIKKVNNYGGDTVRELIRLKKELSCIRSFSTVPVTILYWLENQINLWNEAGLLDIPVSIDASGRFTKPLQIIEGYNSSPIFFYNITIHFKRKVYSISQMLSSQHDVVQISTWLAAWAASVSVMPKGINLDCSYALLNSACLIFNRLTYIQTLNCSLQYVIEKQKQKKDSKFIITAKLPLCNIKRDRAHLLKAMATWKCFSGSNWVKKDFYLRVVGFSLEVDDLDLIIDIVECLFIVCSNEYETKACKEALAFLEKLIGTFNYNLRFNIRDNIQECTEENCHLLQETELNEKNIDADLDGCEAREFILDLKKKAKNKAQTECYVDGDSDNSYYLPTIEKNLINLYSQFTAWTNVMHPFYSFNPSKVSTSCASEVYYRISRKEYGFETPVSLSNFLSEQIPLIEGATKLGRRILKTHVEECSKSNNSSVATDVNSDNKTHVEECSKNKNSPVATDISSNDKIDKILNITEDTETHKRNAEDSLSELPFKKKKNNDSTFDFDCSKVNKDTNENRNKSDYDIHFRRGNNDDEVIQAVFSIDLDYLINMYEISYNLSYVNLLTCAIDLENFQSLKDECYVHGNIVDAYLIIKSRGWKDAHYIPTSQTSYILGDGWKSKHGEDWCMSKLQYQFSRFIFFPFCKRRHWALVVLDLKNHIAYYCDSLTVFEEREAEAKEAFKNYLYKSDETNVLKHITWVWKSISAALPKQNDSHSCALFMTHFIGFFAGEERLDRNFDPYERRKTIAKLLLNDGTLRTENCLHCYNVDKKHFKSKKYTICKTCSRWAHEECLTRVNGKLQGGKCEWCLYANLL